MKISPTFIILLVVISMLSWVYAGPTFSGNQQHFNDFGEINNLENITLLNNPLFIQDNQFNVPILVLNIDPSEVVQLNQLIQTTSGFIFPNTSTAFFGDVNNIDDIDAFSRFSETNLNNGSSASAGFNAVNDLGLIVNFGIGSSNFEIGGENLSNQGAIASFAPTGFDFVNSLTGDWRWRNNPFGNLSFPVRETVMLLTNNGSLDIAGNFTGDQFYAEMFMFDLSGNTITIGSSGIFFNVTGFTVGELNGFDFQNDTLITTKSGLYKIIFSVSYDNTANNNHLFTILHNGSQVDGISSQGHVSTANTISQPTASGFIRLGVGDPINLGVEDIMAPSSNVNIITAQVNLVRIGK